MAAAFECDVCETLQKGSQTLNLEIDFVQSFEQNKYCGIREPAGTTKHYNVCDDCAVRLFTFFDTVKEAAKTKAR